MAPNSPHRPLWPPLAWVLACALASVTAGCGKTAADPPEPSFDARSDALAEVAQVEDVVEADAHLGSTDQVSADLNAPPGSNLHIRLDGPAAVVGARVLVVLAAAEVVQAGLYALGPEHEVHDGIVNSWPMDLFTEAPPGDWVVRAIAIAPGGKEDEWFAVGLSCAADGSIGQVSVSPGGPLQSIGAALTQDEAVESFDQVCGGQPDTFLRPIIEVATPPVANATAHYMAGVVHGERYWLAAYQDGVTSFHFPAAGGAPNDEYNGWTINGGAFCSRIIRHEGRLFCTTRTSVLQVHEVGTASGKAKSSAQVDLGPGLHGEGLAWRAGRVWVASHAEGLRAVADGAPYGNQVVTSPTSLKDAWDVAALGQAQLVLADGAAGVALLDVSGAKHDAPVEQHRVQVPGTAAFVATAGAQVAAGAVAQVAVGALGGGVHVLRVVDGKLQLQGSWTNWGMAYGLSIDGGHVLAGVGSHILALDLPPAGQGSSAPLVLRALQPSPFFALDADPFPGGPASNAIISAEFQGVRLLQRRPEAKLRRALVVEPRIYAPLTAVGQPIVGQLVLRNVGATPLKVSSVRFYEAADSGTAAVKVAGPLTVAAESALTLDLKPQKTFKGSVAHGLVVASDDPLQPLAGVEWAEVPQLQPGDQLPAMSYQDVTGKTVDVSAAFAGRVGVLLVAAESCPVAFYALASAQRVLAPWLAGGKVAAVALNPWNKPQEAPETGALKPVFPVLYTPLSTNDGHDWSEVLDVTLGQPSHHGPPMPIVYVVDAKGAIVSSGWGWRPAEVEAAIAAALGQSN